MDLTQQFQKAYNYAKQNPDSEFATELRKRIEAGQYSNEVQALGLKPQVAGVAPEPQTLLQDAGADLKQVGTDIKSSLAERNTKIEANKAAQASGEQGGLRTGLQNVGQVLGFGADAIGAGIKGAVKTVLPQGAEDAVKSGAEAVIKPVVESAPVQNLMQKYKELKTTNPSLAADIDAALGVGEFIGNFVGLGGAKVAGTAAKEAGEQVLKQGVNAAAKIGESVVGGVDNTLSGAGNALGSILEKGGQKIQNSVIKPSTRDIKDGFKIENIAKYDVGGDLPDTVAKTHVKMNELSNQLAEKLSATDATINLKESYEETVKRLLGDKTKTFGDNSAIERVLENLKSEISSVAPDGNVDLVKGTNVKRGAGTKGAWAYNRPEADASAIEKVYSEFYDVIKNKIEKAAPEGVKEINRQISELIPISNAALRRMTVEERNNVLNITDAIGLTSALFDPKALLLVGANKALKSGKVGEFLTKTGRKIKK